VIKVYFRSNMAFLERIFLASRELMAQEKQLAQFNQHSYIVRLSLDSPAKADCDGIRISWKKSA
jgi:hypothetical protein